MHLDELFVEDIIWVDEYKGLLDATSHIEGCKVIGVDCEWKPNHVKGSKPNKVMCNESPDGIMFLLPFFLFWSCLYEVAWYDFFKQKFSSSFSC